MQSGFPENFHRLHAGEEFVRAKSIEAIEGAEDLLAHARIIETAMNLIDYFVKHYAHANEDELTIQLLGIRIFNGAASAVKLLLSGYYQKSALVQRDMLETVFLLEYLFTDKALITAWRRSDKKERQARFSPRAVRAALHAQDGFSGPKRGELYRELSELAGHATWRGFRMLAPVLGGDAHCGPFFESKMMRAVLEELAKMLVQSGITFTRFFPARRREDYEAAIAWMEAHGAWFEKFFGRPFDRAPLHELRSILAAL